MKTSIAIRRSVRVKFKTDTVLEIVIGNSQTGEMNLYWLDVSGIFPVLKSKDTTSTDELDVEEPDEED